MYIINICPVLQYKAELIVLSNAVTVLKYCTKVESSNRNYRVGLTDQDKAGITHNFGYSICSVSSDPFNIVSYYLKKVTTSWTYSSIQNGHWSCYKLLKKIGQDFLDMPHNMLANNG